eukprot:2850136-Rhodomonas_salina.1
MDGLFYYGASPACDARAGCAMPGADAAGGCRREGKPASDEVRLRHDRGGHHIAGGVCARSSVNAAGCAELR